MTRPKRGKSLKNWNSNRADAGQGKLRIIGGQLRGRLFEYSGDPVTRPMKDNTREALFNLVGGWVPGKTVFDLFAGTGAMGLESLSRGASRACFIERHFPTVRIIQSNAELLDLADQTEVHASDTFFWVRQFAKDTSRQPPEPWLVFCCPPYDLYVQRGEELMEMLASLIELAPDDSLIVVESDERFDARNLPQAKHWEVRSYRPAQVAVLKFPVPSE